MNWHEVLQDALNTQTSIVILLEVHIHCLRYFVLKKMHIWDYCIVAEQHISGKHWEPIRSILDEAHPDSDKYLAMLLPVLPSDAQSDNTLIVPIGRAHINIYCEKISQIWRIRPRLKHRSCDFPTVSDLEVFLNARPLRFPYNIALIVEHFIDHDARFSRKTEILIREGTIIRPNEPIMRQSGLLYVMPDETETTLVLTGFTISAEGRRSFPLGVWDVKLQQGQHNFHFDLMIQPGETKPKLKSQTARLSPNIHDAYQPQEPAKVQARLDPLDIAFVIDATLPSEDFQAVCRWVIDFSQALTQENARGVRLAYVLYGEYNRRFRDGVHYPSRLESRRFDFRSKRYEFEKVLSQESPMPPFEHDFCDALELGLQEALELSWHARKRHLVVIGNSPPHPTIAEAGRFGLADRTIDEFGAYRSWSEVLDECLRSGIHLSSILVEPNLLAKDKYKVDFLYYVWQRIGQFYRAKHSSSAAAFAKSITKTRQKRLVLNKRLEFPLIKSWDDSLLNR